MLDVIEKLLILQDRDRKLIRVRTELARVEPERKVLQGKTSSVLSHLEAAKLKIKQIETERKKLELEVEACKQKIERYSLQQFQTKKNEEYKALGHEIDGCKEAIVKLEDQELEFMEQMEVAQKESAASARLAAETKAAMDRQLSDLGEREENLKRELAELETNRNQLADAVEDSARNRYERLLKSKGENAIVGIEHGVCGGCHMKFPTQILVSCKQEQEIVTCPNCARILYYTRDMDLAVVD
jgi:predicted  nucleic acid-binding Zn-ribbon protein